jgi:hypothetical protein
VSCSDDKIHTQHATASQHYMVGTLVTDDEANAIVGKHFHATHLHTASGVHQHDVSARRTRVVHSCAARQEAIITTRTCQIMPQGSGVHCWSRRLARARLRVTTPAKATVAGSFSYPRANNGTCSRRECCSSCSTAPALNVSHAAIMTCDGKQSGERYTDRDQPCRMDDADATTIVPRDRWP